ncbi:hypothetical protein DRO66_09360 [Candidatus Bathyarchaeota archaeon]|nr:MAG: hypothetical protein DRO66_09360 [Candidatus Bathyarchaeota archaeon]
MYKQASILKENAEFLFARLLKTIKELSEEEAKWKPTTVSNNIEWQLNHLSRITNLSMPRLIIGDHDWAPRNWPSDYKETKHDFQKMIKDIENGKKLVLKELGELSQAQLEKDTNYWGGIRKRKEGIFAYLAEIAHHKGQIAYIRGTYARKLGKKWKFP